MTHDSDRVWDTKFELNGGRRRKGKSINKRLYAYKYYTQEESKTKTSKKEKGQEDEPKDTLDSIIQK